MLNDEALFSRLADEARNYPVIDDPNEQMLMDITSAYQTTLAAVQVTLFSSLSGGSILVGITLGEGEGEDESYSVC